VIEYSVVIPVYNSEATLEELYSRLQSVLKPISGNFEIIFIDDASHDRSWQKLEELHSRDNRVKVIQLMYNFGQHNAIMCGFHFVQGEYVITMDDDLQNPPEEIPKLIDRIKEGYDLVYGEYLSKKHNWFRNIGSSLVQLMYRKVFNVYNNLSAFRIIKRQLIQNILNYDRNYVFIDGLLAWNTKNIGEIRVLHRERKHGRSGYGLGKLITLSLNMITNFSVVPLQMASILGLLFALLGFIMGVLFFVKKIIFGIPLTGYASLIVAITIFSGIQLLSLGLIGEYIGRIHININKRPQYEIRKQLT
jgi:glycosyltransferase involved in cell wall biosynthesis